MLSDIKNTQKNATRPYRSKIRSLMLAMIVGLGAILGAGCDSVGIRAGTTGHRHYGHSYSAPYYHYSGHHYGGDSWRYRSHRGSYDHDGTWFQLNVRDY